MNMKESGAALLEVLIAVALAAMLAGAAGGVVRFGLTAIERAGAASDRGSAALSRRRAIADMLTRIDRAAPGAPAFEGAAHGVRWRGVVIDASGEWRSGIWRLSGSGLALSRCRSFDGPCPAEADLRAASTDVRFAYAGADGEWREEWPPGAPPMLIRLMLSDSAGSTAPLGEIIIAPPRQ